MSAFARTLVLGSAHSLRLVAVRSACFAGSLARQCSTQTAPHDHSIHSNHSHAATDQQLEGTYYRRELPRSCVSFASPEGKARFTSAIGAGTAESYFPLAEQFRTQDEPAFCGVSTLVMALNAMAIDPRRVWKGVWRWFHEDMLSCCKPIEEVKSSGISLEEFCCLARCNGAAAAKVLGAEVSMDVFRTTVMASCSGDPLVEGFVCLNYDRQVLGQTGTGHFSPVAAYDGRSDSALILDVARFKYPPHWVQLGLLHTAIQGHRGYVVLRPAASALGDPLVGSSECELPGFERRTGKPLT